MGGVFSMLAKRRFVALFILGIYLRDLRKRHNISSLADFMDFLKVELQVRHLQLQVLHHAILYLLPLNSTAIVYLEC